MTRNSPLFGAWIALGLVSFFWGTTYLAIKIGVDSGCPPFLLAGVRQASAGFLLILWFLIRRHPLPTWQDLKRMVVPAILMIGMGNGLVTWAEQAVDSGLAAILCSMNPVWVLLITLMFVKDEPVNRKLVAGVIIGFLGILVIFQDNLAAFGNINYSLGILAILIANISWAGGTVYISRNKPGVDPVYSAGIQMFIAGVLMFLISVFTEDPEIEDFNREGFYALLYLIVFGSLVAYGAFLYALQYLPPTTTSIYAYINTVVAVILGWLWLSEPLTWPIMAGTAVTIYGIYLVNTGKVKTLKK